MEWTIVAPFFTAGSTGDADRWLDDFAQTDRHTFRKVHLRTTRQSDWHSRARHVTPVAEWLRDWELSVRALRQTAGGVITVFPHLAATTGARRRLMSADPPIVAWCYNLAPAPGLRRFAARQAMRDVERIIVHSRGEIPVIANWLDIPHDRVEFVHLQCGDIAPTDEEDLTAPFMLSMGSAHRDYACLFDACRQTGIRTIVVASRRSLSGLSVPPSVELRFDLTYAECRRLAQRARISVVPIVQRPTASGQVSVVEAQRMGRPVIATRSVGTVDYIEDGSTGLLVEPADVAGMASAMQRLWEDDDLRRDVAANAASFAVRTLSDEATSAELVRILDDVSSTRP